MIVFIRMETSGAFRRRFQALGHETYSCDILPAEDGGEEMAYSADRLPLGRHLQGDVFDCIDNLIENDMTPGLAIFHPTCTMHTLAAAWAFSDPDFDRYPGVGYHQRVQPGALTGEARRAARDKAEAECERIKALPFPKIIENPKGTLPTRTSYGKPHQIVQPYEFGDDASKATCLWFFDADGQPMPKMAIPIDPAKRVAGRMVEWPKGSGKMVERWSNQTDSGQNNITPGADRWKDRSRTYPGIASAGAAHWGLTRVYT